MARVATLFCLLSGTSALQIGTTRATRRDAVAGAFGAASAASLSLAAPQAAQAVSARTGLSSVFTGEYDDPNHPGCLRSIKVIGGGIKADGTRGKPMAVVKGIDDGCADPQLAKVWELEGKLSKNDDGEDLIFIDFSPKDGPKNLMGKYDTFGGIPGITFPDGNKWTKVAAGTPSRRPPNLTLNSD